MMTRFHRAFAYLVATFALTAIGIAVMFGVRHAGPAPTASTGSTEMSQSLDALRKSVLDLEAAPGAAGPTTQLQLQQALATINQADSTNDLKLEFDAASARIDLNDDNIRVEAPRVW